MTTDRKITRKKFAPAVRETAAAQDYPSLLAEAKACIQSAQHAALRTVNKEPAGLYREYRVTDRGAAADRWLGQGCGETAFHRPARGLPWRTWVFNVKPVVHAPVLSGVQRRTKTPTTGWRNQLLTQPAHRDNLNAHQER